ncbi:MAG: hypothetical protein ACYSYV_01105 [Planctomycetota bacterium]|jgi:hypothetical protein
MRKFLIGFVSLGAVLVVYLLYSRVSDTRVVDSGPEAEFTESAADSNIGDFDSQVGKIGDVGLGPVRKAKYIILDPKTKEVEREWGFEILRDEVGDIWGIDKPYVNIYRRNFKCYITADKGQVQVETAVGRTTPKDATFSDNVVVHILPEGSSTVQESFVYLDNITFLSERSQLSTAGPVRFVSRDVQMSGTGLELIYDDQKERLDFFRIIDLESLRIKGSQAALFSTGKTEADRPPEAGEPAEAGSQAETQQPGETVAAGSPEKAEALPPDTQPQVEQKQGAYYKCIFSKNVLIDTPDELVFADERICISDIFWSKTSSEPSDEVGAGGADDIEPVAVTTEEEQEDKATEVSADDPGRQNVTASKPAEPNESSEQLGEIVVTSDNGFVLVPMDSTRPLDDYSQPRIEEGASDSERPEVLDDDTGRTRFLAPRIDYNATTGDVIADGLSQLTYYTSDAKTAEANETPVPVKITAREAVNYFKASNQAIFKGDCLCTMPQAGLTEQKDVTFLAPEITINLPEDRSKRPDIFAAGPTELVFYVEDANSTGIKKEPIPVTVNAQKQTRFSAASNQIVFEGDCRCTSAREDPNVLTTYMLLSQQITVDLPEDTNDRSTEPAAGIKHLTAKGGVVTLATTKTAKADPNLAGQVPGANSEKLLGGVELKCRQVDYDPVRGLFVAAGPPAIIEMDNSKISESRQEPGRVSLRKPCYAFLQEFDTLKYFIRENRIVADAGTQRLLIDYFSVVEGKYAEHVEAEASRVEAFLYETAAGQTELSTLRATGGIDYEDKDNHFIGSELFYNHKKSMLKVKGDESQPCYYNGALVDEIEYDMETGRAEFEIVGPGALQTNR